MLDKVKLALRITTNFLDDEIIDSINEAKAELIRSGVPEPLVASENELVTKAIKTYCQAHLTGDMAMRDKYLESFMYQQDCLRKSSIEVEDCNV